MLVLSKSKLLAYRQCPKRLWLEIHRPTLRHDSATTTASFSIGNQVGEIARQMYDPTKQGQMVDVQGEGIAAALAHSTVLLNSSQPIFEAGFRAAGALAFADVLLPVTTEGTKAWRMIEVKSSTSVKYYHRDDVAVQAFVARSAGVDLRAIALAHIDSSWVYPGGGDYQGLLQEHDLTAEAFDRGVEVEAWIADAQHIASQVTEPQISTGRHCEDPYECGFLCHCRGQEPPVDFPASWLPRVQSKALKKLIVEDGVTDMRAIPDELLTQTQLRVKRQTLAGEIYFDAINAASDLSAIEFPVYFLDFETTQFAVPIWAGTRPYQQIPFQFSLHCFTGQSPLEHYSFLDLTGQDPSEAFAQALVDSCGKDGPVFVYNAGFEMARIKELAIRFPLLRESLLAINERVVDLLRIAEQRYYHPSQQGSWSIKKVLPTIAPDLRYDALEGIKDGGMAMTAYQEAISPESTEARKKQIHQQLLAYCGLDTLALVRLWQFFSGRNDAVS